MATPRADPRPPPGVSFEVFPPSEPLAARRLWDTATRLGALEPRFFSVTYGAAGSSLERTRQCVVELMSRSGLPVAPHLSCAGVDRESLRELVRAYWDHGVRRVVALRGDGLNGDRFVPHPRGLVSAIELVELIRAVAPFDISVAAYPESHPEAASGAADLEHLQRKLEAGASRALTQFFFDAEVYLRFRDRCAARGIRQPIVPGILPINDLAQTARFARRCGASLPAWVAERFVGVEADSPAHREVATATAIALLERLWREGVGDFHLYTLNRAELPWAICTALGWGAGSTNQPDASVARNLASTGFS
ncbi:MAG: methylenetetrahydrofolate reductase [NAD(P)H] [Gammaproteobacteria bacterium]|nr:methylenetetrahydrofolate reductase [NAD(P)H] [Gammaproteobacteria bacterium]